MTICGLAEGADCGPRGCMVWVAMATGTACARTLVTTPSSITLAVTTPEPGLLHLDTLRPLRGDCAAGERGGWLTPGTEGDELGERGGG